MLLDGSVKRGRRSPDGDLVIPALVDYGGVIALSSRIPRPGDSAHLAAVLVDDPGEWI